MAPMRHGVLCVMLLLGAAAQVVEAQSAQALYARALEVERAVRTPADPTSVGLTDIRAVIRAYRTIVARYPTSGYSDNALWQAAGLAFEAFERFGQEIDRKTGLELLRTLAREYPSSSRVKYISERIRQFESTSGPGVAATAAAAPVGSRPAPPAEATSPAANRASGSTSGTAPATAASTRPPSAPPVMIRSVQRTPLAAVLRITIELDGEVPFRQERLLNPPRVFFDLERTQAVPHLQDATLRFDDDAVREIRLGRHPRDTTRVVIDLARVARYNVFTLYNPFRLVIDCERVPPVPTTSTASPVQSEAASTLEVAAAAVSGLGITPPPAGAPPLEVALPRPIAPPPSTTPSSGVTPPVTVTPPPAAMPSPAVTPPAEIASSPVVARPPIAAPPSAPATLPTPTIPAANAGGGFSLARQLGLGVSKVVIDPGHGGHDPGAQALGVSEAELVLDVALRLEALLLKDQDIEVVLTRREDLFVPLQERTEIANRSEADLFLSIHANASRNRNARGVETYILNFATTPEAEAVAARENSASEQSMGNLSDIVRAIALNTKVDESRDLAVHVQQAMIKRLRPSNPQLKSLGIKQAPFVVLIGALMPSVLAEVSFLTNAGEGRLLKTPAYRQGIAEALRDAIVSYRGRLKGVSVAQTR